MHPEDFEELGELGFGFAWPGIVEIFREVHGEARDQPPVYAGPGRRRSADDELVRTTRCALPEDWMALRSN